MGIKLILGMWLDCLLMNHEVLTLEWLLVLVQMNNKEAS